MRAVLLPALLTLLILPVAGNAAPRPDPADVERGQYLVNLLGCGRCHTEGYLAGQTPTGPLLAGSQIGIAYSAYDGKNEKPGVVFPPNLTPDPDTGIGGWSRTDIIKAMRTGIGKDGYHNLPVMPSANYATLSKRDVQAIAAYLQSLPAVRREIPKRSAPGTDPAHPYVRFGIYLFEPSGEVEQRAVP